MKITIRATDDWVNVFKDGVSVWANHSCPLKEGLEMLGIDFEYEYRDNDDSDEFYDWIEAQ